VNGRGAPDGHLVVAGLLVRRDRVLLCHRTSERVWFPDVWDVPGGHVENGETRTGALVRELHEELGIVIVEPAESDAVRVVTGEFDLSVWVIGQWAGRPGNAAPREHDDVSWFSLDQVSSLPLADASYLDLLTNALAGPP
jgi:8-oxo-dGTP pyrophosphatase MutT (NUDIX family)